MKSYINCCLMQETTHLRRKKVHCNIEQHIIRVKLIWGMFPPTVLTISHSSFFFSWNRSSCVFSILSINEENTKTSCSLKWNFGLFYFFFHFSPTISSIQIFPDNEVLFHVLGVRFKWININISLKHHK